VVLKDLKIGIGTSTSIAHQLKWEVEKPVESLSVAANLNLMYETFTPLQFSSDAHQSFLFVGDYQEQTMRL
jgi:hypothetical protein